MNRRGFFSMLAAVVALPWVGRKPKPITWNLETVYKDMDKGQIERIKRAFEDHHQGVLTINEVRILRNRKPA